MRDPRGEYHKRGEHEHERPLILRRGVLEVKRRQKANAELHVGHLEGNAAGVVNRFLHAVTGDAALNELVLAQLADLEDKAPLAVDSLDDRLLGEDERARASLRERETGRGEVRWHGRDACRRCQCRKNSSESPASSHRTGGRRPRRGLLG